MKKQTQPKEVEFYAEGNRGGDYLKILFTQGSDELVVEVGHQCVISISHRIPVAVLTTVLTDWRDRGMKLPEVWSEELTKQLEDRIKPL